MPREDGKVGSAGSGVTSHCKVRESYSRGNGEPLGARFRQERVILCVTYGDRFGSCGYFTKRKLPQKKASGEYSGLCKDVLCSVVYYSKRKKGNNTDVHQLGKEMMG